MSPERTEGRENLPSIKRFLPVEKRILRKAGFIILELTGRSIRELRELGFLIDTTLDEQYPGFDELRSISSEVAIYPEFFFLKGSSRHSMGQQIELVDNYSKLLQDDLEIRGIQAIMGQAADYIDLVYSYSQRERKKLFGKRHNLDFTRTATSLSKDDSNFAVVGRNEENGLKVYGWEPNLTRDDLHVAPLIVPK